MTSFIFSAVIVVASTLVLGSAAVKITLCRLHARAIEKNLSLFRDVLAPIQRPDRLKRSRPIIPALHIPSTLLKSCSCVVFGQIAHRHMEIPRMQTEHYQARIFPRPWYCLWCSLSWYHDFIILLTALISGRFSSPVVGLYVLSWIYICLLEIMWILDFSFITITTNSRLPIRFTHFPGQQLPTRVSSNNIYSSLAISLN